MWSFRSLTVRSILRKRDDSAFSMFLIDRCLSNRVIGRAKVKMHTLSVWLTLRKALSDPALPLISRAYPSQIK